MIFANVGLTQILKISEPVLTAIYPMAIVLMILALCHNMFKGNTYVYMFSVLFTSIFSILKALEEFNIKIHFLNKLPLYTQGLGWAIPAIIGGLSGLIYGNLKDKKSEQVNNII